MKFQELVDAVKDLQAKVTDFLKGESAKETGAADQLKAFQTALEKIQADAAAHEKALTDANAKLSELQGQIKSKDEEIAKLKADAKTADELAAEKARKVVASQGVKAAELPQGASGSQTTEQKLEALQKQIAAETDPAKKYELAAEANKLRFGKKEKA